MMKSKMKVINLTFVFYILIDFMYYVLKQGNLADIISSILWYPIVFTLKIYPVILCIAIAIANIIVKNKKNDINKAKKQDQSKNIGRDTMVGRGLMVGYWLLIIPILPTVLFMMTPFMDKEPEFIDKLQFFILFIIYIVSANIVSYCSVLRYRDKRIFIGMILVSILITVYPFLLLVN